MFTDKGTAIMVFIGLILLFFTFIIVASSQPKIKNAFAKMSLNRKNDKADEVTEDVVTETVGKI